MAVYTEMTYASWLAGKLESLFEQGKLRWISARVETKVPGEPKRADIIISTATRAELVIEVKRPENHEDNPFAQAVVLQARDYAKARGIGYFVTHNIQSFATWSVSASLPLDQAFVAPVDTVQEFESFANQILEAWKALLPRLAVLISTGKPPLPLEATFAEMVGENIDSIIGSTTIVTETAEKIIADPVYRKQFDSWLASRGRNPPQNVHEAQAEAGVFSKQVLYAWCNQLLFYRAIQQRYHLDPLLTSKLESVEAFASSVNSRFSEAMRATGDFETVFVPTAEILPVCDAKATRKIVALARNLDYYDFSQIPYDLLGGLFQRLLLQRERHLMGQFFTPAPLADLIISLVGKPGASYLDPACGSGTFLVRSYNRIRVEEGLAHKDILPRTWGFDLAQFPAHLATVNLALQDLSETDNHPNVARRDFFSVLGSKDTLSVSYARTTLAAYGGGGKPT
ncbi:MAG TPA: N-6 DNA methylase [Thermoplasmata archaeon]|nr:N-6 DNA methylase [Thermoplasmata archaeon]